eukprot:6188586-Pleurochrysis_carterae.AAC.1
MILTQPKKNRFRHASTYKWRMHTDERAARATMERAKLPIGGCQLVETMKQVDGRRFRAIERQAVEAAYRRASSKDALERR